MWQSEVAPYQGQLNLGVYRAQGASPVVGPAHYKVEQIRPAETIGTALTWLGAQAVRNRKMCLSQHNSHPNTSSTDCSSAPDPG